MAPRRTILIAAVIALGVANVAIYASFGAESMKPKQQSRVPSDKQISLFQIEADKACLCTRRAGTAAHDRCWATYERSVAQAKPERLGTMCMGAHYWDFFAGERSVTLQRAGDACTENEELATLAEWRRQGLIEPDAADIGGCR
jgi:hypothetical protein